MSRQPGSGQRPLRADARRNLQRLLVEAQRAFAEHGMDASLEDIARRAGVGIGTLYRHFPTRQELIEAAFIDGIDTLRARAEELHTASSPREAIHVWMQEFAEYASVSRGVVEAIKSGLDEPQSPLNSCCTTMRDAAGKLLARSQEIGAIRADLTISELFRIINGIAWAADRRSSPDANRLVRLVLEGIEP